MTVLSIHHQLASDEVMECVSVEVVGGPKPFARFWPATGTLEWAWVLHPTAKQVWPMAEAVIFAGPDELTCGDESGEYACERVPGHEGPHMDTITWTGGPPSRQEPGRVQP